MGFSCRELIFAIFNKPLTIGIIVIIVPSCSAVVDCSDNGRRNDKNVFYFFNFKSGVNI